MHRQGSVQRRVGHRMAARAAAGRLPQKAAAAPLPGPGASRRRSSACCPRASAAPAPSHCPPLQHIDQTKESDHSTTLGTHLWLVVTSLPKTTLIRLPRSSTRYPFRAEVLEEFPTESAQKVVPCCQSRSHGEPVASAACRHVLHPEHSVCTVRGHHSASACAAPVMSLRR